jgi:hypothetical protein
MVVCVPRKPKRFTAKITIVVEKEVKDLLVEYCNVMEFDSLTACLRWILKKYFEFIASRKIQQQLRSRVK